MQATADFTAHIDGVEYSLKKGEEFDGGSVAAEHLKKLGLLKAKSRKVEKDER